MFIGEDKLNSVKISVRVKVTLKFYLNFNLSLTLTLTLTWNQKLPDLKSEPQPHPDSNPNL